MASGSDCYLSGCPLPCRWGVNMTLTLCCRKQKWSPISISALSLAIHVKLRAAAGRSLELVGRSGELSTRSDMCDTYETLLNPFICMFPTASSRAATAEQGGRNKRLPIALADFKAAYGFVNREAL
jgi:hypothetical protein